MSNEVLVPILGILSPYPARFSAIVVQKNNVIRSKPVKAKKRRKSGSI